MRTGKSTLTLLLVLGLLGGAFAVPALAQESGDADATDGADTSTGNETATDNTSLATNETPTDNASTWNESGTNETASNETSSADDSNATEEDRRGPQGPWADYVRNLRESRQAALAAFKDQRAAAADAFHARIAEIRESYLENKTRVIEACHAASEADANATEEDAETDPHCIRDGLRPLKDEARAALRDAKDTFVSTMKDARKAALDEWKDARDAARAQYREDRAAAGAGNGHTERQHGKSKAADRPEVDES